ncbi:YIPPEE-LIKE PROTEIN [Salix viminalis]|uniref:YIPPEE-LIKE PROTEIN n=1 Tax=Salix viminalis TaxID=40686 RepID=A0A9Q0ZP23_SALVM|nr:YIPPEE-LIKE PROTEIN [Salix viminalis]
MGRLFIETVNDSRGESGEGGGGRRIFKCKWCKVEFASYYDIFSKDFQGRYGRAYLFRKVVNISLGPNEERKLASGFHTVRDIYCTSCQQILGWKYEKAVEESQKYKEGMFILEKERMLKEGWLKTWNLVLSPPKIIQARAKTCRTECSGWPARRFESRLHIGDTEPTPENIAAGHRLVAALSEKIVEVFVDQETRHGSALRLGPLMARARARARKRTKKARVMIPLIKAEEDDNEEEIEEGLDDEEETVTVITFYRGKLCAISYYNAIYMYVMRQAMVVLLGSEDQRHYPLSLRKKERGRWDFQE